MEASGKKEDFRSAQSAFWFITAQPSFVGFIVKDSAELLFGFMLRRL